MLIILCILALLLTKTLITMSQQIVYTLEIPTWEVFLQKKAEMKALPKNQSKWTQEIYLKSSYLTDAIQEFIKLNTK